MLLTYCTKTYVYEFCLIQMSDIRSNKRRNVRMNVILRSFRVTITAMKNNKHYLFPVCTCILSYLARHEERMLHFILSSWPVWLFHIFSHYLINGTIVEKIYWTEHICFGFLYKFFYLKYTVLPSEYILTTSPSAMRYLWMYVCLYICMYVCMCVYRVSQEERTKIREGVPYVKLYQYNPKHLYPKLNGYGDNGKRSLKLWQLFTHLLIAKFILKLAGICGFCNVNICT